MKLLYFLDFRHFKETGKSVTGLYHTAWEKGPVLVSLYDEISSDKLPQDIHKAIKIVKRQYLQLIVPRKEFDGKYFTKRENGY